MSNLLQSLAAVLLIAAIICLPIVFSKRWKLPRPPTRLGIFSFLLWLILRSIFFGSTFKHFNASDELILAYSGTRYFVWLVLECPPSLGLFKPLANVLRDLVFWLIFGVSLVFILKIHGGLDLAPLLTTSAVLTAVLGLALQEPLKDFFAGIEIQIDPPFRNGDWLEVGGTSGIVVNMNLMDTALRMVDNSLLSIPNGKITDDSLRVFRAGTPVGNDFSVSLDYQLPPGQAIQFLKSILHSNIRVLREPEPSVWIGSYDDFSIRYDIIAYQDDVTPYARNDLKSELLSQVWYALEREGRSFPYPVMELTRWQPIPAPNDPASLLDQDKLFHLKKGWLFKGLDDEQLDLLVSNVRFVRFAPGEMIVNQGDQGSTLYQVILGQVEVLICTPDKPPLSVALIGEDGLLGEMSLLTGEPRAASLRSFGECMLLEIERRDLQPILQADPELLEGLASMVAERRAALEKLSSADAENREQGILAMMRKLFA